MNILFDHEIFARQKFGGVSRYFYEVIKGIAENYDSFIDLFLGYNITGFDFNSIKKNIVINEKKLNYPYKLHFIVNMINKSGFKNYVSGKKFDLFHKTYYSDIGLDLKIPKVSTVHDMTHELFPYYFTKNDDTTERKKSTVKSSDAVICVSETTKKDLVEIFKYDPSKIKVIYHGITLKDDTDLKNIINEPYLLYVGQRWGYKNFNLLLSAFAHDKVLNKNYKLICFGGGEFNYSEKLFIKKNSLENRVIQVNGNDNIIKSLYKYAEIFIYTSFYEGFGFPPLEAMEFNCPVISSPGGSVKEVLGDAALYFDPKSGNDLLVKIHNLLNDSALKLEFTKRGKQQVKLFSWDKSVLEHYNFYKEILSK